MPVAAVLPLFVSVIAPLVTELPVVTLPNAAVTDESPSEATSATPVPETLTLGLPPLVEEIVTLPLLAPAELGENRTPNVQLEPAARVLPQLFETML